jgi:two-component system cell cycle sensor histidine kinase/response regulator CckA
MPTFEQSLRTEAVAASGESANAYDARLNAVAREASEHAQTPRGVAPGQDLLVRAQYGDSLQILVGGVAHDFANLLQGILANAEMARVQHAEPAQAAERLQSISVAATRAWELCRQMLAYTGRGARRVERLDLHVLIADMVPLLRASVSRRVVIDSRPESEQSWVMGDPTQLRQLLMNLVINAGQSIGERAGNVLVRTRRQLDGAAPVLLLEVQDDGCGIDPVTLDRMFDPFFTTKQGGRGLGLAAVRDVVAAHGGTIEVHSALGVGTRFAVSLPLEATREHARIDPRRVPTDLGGGRALFVDDDETVRRIGRTILEHAGFDVTEAANGAEAVDRVRGAPAAFRLVVLDMTMPVMDGPETLEQIRTLSPSLPVVLSSGLATRELGALTAQDPNTVVVAKPYAPEQLLCELQRLLRAAAP